MDWFPAMDHMDYVCVGDLDDYGYAPISGAEFDRVGADQPATIQAALKPATLPFDAALKEQHGSVPGRPQILQLGVEPTSVTHQAADLTGIFANDEESLKADHTRGSFVAFDLLDPTDSNREQPVAGTKVEYANPSEWEKYKDVISQLYREKQLKEVVSIMKTKYNFHATEKMFKDRTKAWRVSKYLKSPEMRAIAHKVDERSRANKRTASSVWGKEVPYSEVVRYWKRRKLTIEQILAERERSPTPPGVRCVTPTQLVPSTPKNLALGEELLHQIETYFTGSIENGSWISLPGSQDLCSVENTDRKAFNSLRIAFESTIISVNTLFFSGRFVEGGKALISATSFLEDLILLKDPMTLPVVFECCMYWWFHHGPQLSLIIPRQFSALAIKVLRENDPLHQLCHWLLKISKKDRKSVTSVLQRCFNLMTAIFETHLGRWHITTFRSRLRATKRHVQLCGFEQQIAMLTQMKDELFQLNDIENWIQKLADVKLHLAFTLSSTGAHSTAQKLVYDVLELPIIKEPQSLRAPAFYTLAHISYYLKDLTSAIARLRQAIRECNTIPVDYLV